MGSCSASTQPLPRLVEVLQVGLGESRKGGMASIPAEVRVISRRTVRPTTTPKEEDHPATTIHLTVWDLKLLPVDYIQKCIFLHKPPTPPCEAAENGDHPIISRLLSSFSQALDLFFPLAGRLATAIHDDGDVDHPPSFSVFLSCTNQGAEFIHASAPDFTLSDILTPFHIPAIVSSIFPLNGAISHDGHSSPLLAVQVTELADGVIIACSLNHTVADGTTFWGFLNTWSAISRAGAGASADSILHPPVLNRWFPDSIRPPVYLPSSIRRDFTERTVLPPVKECFFSFSAKTIARLKAKANAEMGCATAAGSRISSLQSLLAHAWRAVTRARRVRPDQETTYFLLVGSRSRLNPPLPQAYLGNAVDTVPARAAAGEVVGRGLGWAAWQLNQAVASQTEEEVRRKIESWAKSPSYELRRSYGAYDLVTGSSPRFDVFGNDFGWGRPVAVRSGRGNKWDGKVTVYPGEEEGSMGLEFCISPEAMSVLVEDKEFMETVCE